MRYSPLAVLALAAAVTLPAPAGAQTPRVEITGVRVGFPGSIHRAGSGMGPQGRFKPGHWAPVYVDLDVREAALKAGTYVLQVETTDSDDMQNVYVEKRFLPTVEPKEQPTLLTYVRLGSGNSEVNVRLLDAALAVLGVVGVTDQSLQFRKGHRHAGLHPEAHGCYPWACGSLLDNFPEVVGLRLLVLGPQRLLVQVLRLLVAEVDLQRLPAVALRLVVLAGLQ